MRTARVRNVTYLGLNRRRHTQIMFEGRLITISEDHVVSTNLEKVGQVGWIEIPQWVADKENLPYRNDD